MNKEIKNKWVSVNGYVLSKGGIAPQTINCIITNDKLGKSLSIGTEQMMFEIAFEDIEEYLR